MIILDSVKNENLYFWGKRTSTLDWCEENYAKNHYIAEFWNTLTNFAFSNLAYSGISSDLSANHGKRLIACRLGFLLVGIGSMCFHATLKYSTQLLDELPMLYVATLSSYALLEIHPRPRFGWKLPLALFLINLAVTLAYLWVVDPIFHQVVFASFVLFCFARGYVLMGKLPDDHTKHTLILLLSRSALMFIAGFGVWNLDNFLCHRLRSYRSYLQFPLDGLLQLHGWWHILTGYACHYAFTFIILLRTVLWNDLNRFELKYNEFAVPNVVLRRHKSKPF
ncbi:alkaline ceramidase ydc1 [Spiromyces aspiralis]|uniref:Alkaline ceramidase ydc1 n=1 Tax=Spiromyces aspiralis TaxID=68401 RepID=A0ACC1HN59_9FUNG|nr:alkaline ceramidase ydc1 [Spiromyces aspiralis]